MKSPANKSAPKARVMYQDRPTETNNGMKFHARPQRIDTDDTVGVFIPTRTVRQAAQLARFANLTWEEKVEELALRVANIPRHISCQGKARLLLASLGEQPGKGEGE